MRSVAAAVLVAAGLPQVANALRATGRDNSDCTPVVFEHTDASLHVRTMVVQDSTFQRMLVLTPEDDKSEPCELRWWLDHNPQGMIKCNNGPDGPPTESVGGVCKPEDCKSDPYRVELGYVRTMLASTLYSPDVHALAAICVELGCRSRIVRTRVAGTLLEAAPEVKWTARPAPRRVLVIGLGTSTMALWLRAALPDTELHIAELSPSVVAAAPCFGLNTSDPMLKIHTGDGRATLEASADRSFDAILLDAYDSNAMLPDCFQTQEFFAMAKSKLSFGGALSLNLVSNEGMMSVLSSLMSNFEAKRVFTGNAPGAEGVQNVITAFAPGRLAGGSAPRPGSASEQGHRWFDAAAFRHVHMANVAKAQPFKDAKKCPAAAK